MRKWASWPHTLHSTNTTLVWLKSHGMSKYGISSLKVKLKNRLSHLALAISIYLNSHLRKPKPHLFFFSPLAPVLLSSFSKTFPQTFQFLEMKLLQVRVSPLESELAHNLWLTFSFLFKVLFFHRIHGHKLLFVQNKKVFRQIQK